MRLRWGVVIGLAALHPVLLYYLAPHFGERANLVVFLAPVVATFLFGLRIGLMFIPVNVIATSVMFGGVLNVEPSIGLRPKGLLAALVVAGLCLVAEKIRRLVQFRRLHREEFERAKKMEAIGRLAGGVAHDMNNTLNAIMGSIFAHRQELAAYGRRFQDLDNIAAACDRGAQLTQNLLGFARKSSVKSQVFSLNRVVQATELLLRRTASKQIRIVSSLASPEPYMEGDLGQIENALMNLCLNALDAMGKIGTLTLKTGVNNKMVFLRVSDTGEGMDRHTQEHVFEPFFTTKAEGKGTGLGLAIVYGAVHAMKGR
ncbi:MAG: hypothetical protein JXX14_01470, partial [Deltaproteobacteria bacterium]|nr:hypothetical protein [Deltaproteobacteria bacterium]